MPELLLTVGIIIFLIFCFVKSGKENLKECNSVLQNWAKKERYSIVESEPGIECIGSQCVFYITIKTENNKIKTGRVIFVSVFIGLLSDKVEVIWDDEKLKS